MKTLTIKTNKRNEFIDITYLVRKNIDIENGIVHVFVPHTTAGITINENADVSVREDMLRKLSELAPEDDNYKHSEGNSDAHIKTSLMGNSVFVAVENKELILGTWQGIFFCEFDGPRKRKIMMSFLKAS